jgi:hypothetical protein
MTSSSIQPLPDWYTCAKPGERLYHLTVPSSGEGEPIQYGLDFYIDKLASGQHFSRPYWGDQEARQGILKEHFLLNRHGGREVADIIEAYMLQGSEYAMLFGNFFVATMRRPYAFGLYNIVNKYTYDKPGNEDGLGYFRWLESRGMDKYLWHDGLLFLLRAYKGQLGPLLAQFNRMNVCVVAPEQCRPIMEKGLRVDHWIDVVQEPSRGVYQAHDVIEAIEAYGRDNTVYLICVGEGSTVVITEMYYKKPYNWYIDMGICLDELSGYKYAGHDHFGRKDPEEEKLRREEFYATLASNLDGINDDDG